MNPDFQTGLLVSIVGLSVTFTALLIFIGVIVLLKKLFPYKEDKAETNDDDTYEETPMLAAEENDEEIAAAIAAVIYLRGQHSNQLGAALTNGKSPFWTAD